MSDVKWSKERAAKVKRDFCQGWNKKDGQWKATEDQADNCREKQDQHQITTGNKLNEFGHDQTDTGQSHGTNDDTRSGRCDTDTNHVAGT